MESTLADPLLGRVIDGRYEVRQRVAAGGMATVYVAFDRRLERSVAIKIMRSDLGTSADRQEFSSRFRREARAAARLTHPRLVRVYDQGTDGDLSYLTMEFIEGSNLRQRLTAEGTLAVGEALGIAEQVLDALQAAHRQSLVHRDIKPENILLDEDGVKVADFGLARAVTEVTATSTGTIMGTVSYLSPELVQHGTSDARTDLYAVGVLLFELVTGRRPLSAASEIEVAARHVHEDIPAPSTYVPWLPAEFDELVLSLAARSPDDRPADATAALTRVRQTRAMMDDPTLARSADPPSGQISLSGETPTAILDASPSSSTMALPIGLGENTLDHTYDAEIIDDDPEALAPRRERSRAGMWVGALLGALALVVGLGAWWYATQGPGAYTTVPPVLGETTDDARAILASAGLDVVVLTDFSDDVPAGLVVSTDPGPQAQIARDDSVRMTVSKGPRMEEVPDVVGVLEPDALDILGDIGFDAGQITRVYSDTAPEGEVMDMSPEPGEVIPHYTAIDLVISQGPQPITIPDMVGRNISTARDILENSFALEVVVEYETSLEVPADQVISTSPEPGAESTRTATITLVVSEGLPIVTVPDFFGADIDVASSRAEELGLEVVTERIPGFGRGDNTVVTQSLEPGDDVEWGTIIVLRYRD